MRAFLVTDMSVFYAAGTVQKFYKMFKTVPLRASHTRDLAALERTLSVALKHFGALSEAAQLQLCSTYKQSSFSNCL